MEKFNPTMEELKTLAVSCGSFTINGIEDEQGYSDAKTKLNLLRSKRIEITKKCKEIRDDAIVFQKAVIVQEKEMVSIIEPVEQILKQEIEKIDEAKKIEERRKVLPARIQEMERVGIADKIHWTEEMILSMTSDQFNKFVLDTRQQLLEEQEKKLQEEKLQQKYAERKLILDQNGVSMDFIPNRTIAEYSEEQFQENLQKLIQNKKDIEEKAKKDAEEKIAKQQEEEKIKQEQERIKKEQEEAREIERKKIEEAALAKSKKYNDWLIENGCTKENMSDYYIHENGNTKILYKKISTFII